MLGQAERAFYVVKGQGKGTYQCYDAAIDRGLKEREQLCETFGIPSLASNSNCIISRSCDWRMAASHASRRSCVGIIRTEDLFSRTIS